MFTFRQLAREDLNEIWALYLVIQAALPSPEILRIDDRDYILDNIIGSGRTFGAFCGEALIAYASVRFPGDTQDNLAHDVPALTIPALRVAVYDGSGVHPQHRGRGLQQRLNFLRYSCAIASGHDHLMGTVSPLNVFSLHNHLSAGFFVKAIVQKYGGWSRFIIHRGGSTIEMDLTTEQASPLQDLSSQEPLLERGYWGYKIQSCQGRKCLVYAAPKMRTADPDLRSDLS